MKHHFGLKIGQRFLNVYFLIEIDLIDDVFVLLLNLVDDILKILNFSE